MAGLAGPSGRAHLVLGLLAALAASGCLADAPPAQPWLLPTDGGRLAVGTESLRFTDPLVALEGCGMDFTVACFEPSIVAAGPAVLLVSNGYGRNLARSPDAGSTWLPALSTSPLDQPMAAGGDALVQRAPDGSVWRSALLQTSVTAQRSTDGGLTWSTDGIASFGVPVDRNWLGFLNEAVFLHIQGPEGLHVAVSRDLGATWSEPRRILPDGLHGPGASVAGRFVFPAFDYAAGELVAFASPDGSAWERHLISKRIGTFFPALAADGDIVHAAWQGFDNALLVASSGDGGRTWSPPIVASRPGETMQGSPWIVAEGAALAVVYFTAADLTAPANLQALRIVDGKVERGTVAQGISSNGIKTERPGNTDHAHADLTREGWLVTVFADGEGRILASIGR